jgi:hypothetical protein
MPSPFPGMDPYIERPAIWADFHDSFITFVRGALQPQLRPNYFAIIQERLIVGEARHSRYPDVSVAQTKGATPSGQRSATAGPVVQDDEPLIFELDQEVLRQPYIQIVESAGEGRLVTAIEVLSPDNKRGGPGRRSYLRKRRQLWRGGANLVEIDLLRDGKWTVRVHPSKLQAAAPWHYLAVITRQDPAQEEVYRMILQRRLPGIRIPLVAANEGVHLDLQAIFARCWDEGPYPQVLKYDGLPPGKMDPDQAEWCLKQLRDAGLRNGR